MIGKHAIHEHWAALRDRREARRTCAAPFRGYGPREVVVVEGDQHAVLEAPAHVGSVPADVEWEFLFNPLM